MIFIWWYTECAESEATRLFPLSLTITRKVLAILFQYKKPELETLTQEDVHVFPPHSSCRHAMYDARRDMKAHSSEKKSGYY